VESYIRSKKLYQKWKAILEIESQIKSGKPRSNKNATFKNTLHTAKYFYVYEPMYIHMNGKKQFLTTIECTRKQRLTLSPMAEKAAHTTA